jgi:predicted  nucleic acid-binding Zn-ribbon protein
LSYSTLIKDEINRCFSLRAAQEIKNNTDFVYQMNQEIQTLKTRMDSLEKSIKDLANVASNYINTSNDLYKTRNTAILEKFDEIKASVNEISADQIKMNFRISNEIDLIKRNYVDVPTMNISLSVLKRSHDGMVDEINDLRGKLVENYCIVKTHVDKARAELNEKVVALTPDLEPIKSSLDQELKIVKVDFASLVLEIERIKRDNLYDTKKIEYCMTAIERMKKGDA